MAGEPSTVVQAAGAGVSVPDIEVPVGAGTVFVAGIRVGVGLSVAGAETAGEAELHPFRKTDSRSTVTMFRNIISSFDPAAQKWLRVTPSTSLHDFSKYHVSIWSTQECAENTL
jgi:hypothetical protein